MIRTPVYRAAYSELLEALLDLLRQYVLAGKAVLPPPPASAPSTTWPPTTRRVPLTSMGAAHIVPGWFTLDKDIAGVGHRTVIASVSAEAFGQAAGVFSAELTGWVSVLAS